MPVMSQTLPGAPGGMNLALPAQELDDTEARYIQDALLDQPGLVRSRGPVAAIAGFPATTYRGSGIVVTVDPVGNDRYAVLNGDTTHGLFSMLNPGQTAYESYTWPYNLNSSPSTSVAQAHRVMDSKPTPGGGAWIGVSSGYGADVTEQVLAKWEGGYRDTYTAGTIRFTGGSYTVQGTGTLFTTKVTPGMYIFATVENSAYTPGSFFAAVKPLIGVVRSIESDTSLTLQSPSPYASSGTGWNDALAGLGYKAWSCTPVRGFQYKIAKGLITTSITSTTVTGGKTKFISMGMPTVVEGSRSSNYWNIYRASDMTWIGRVTQAVSETSVTLVAVANIAVVDTPYVALRGDGDWGLNLQATTTKPGWLNATYAELGWFANVGTSVERTSRVYFSEPSDPESMDTSTYDGDFIDIASTVATTEPIRGLLPTYNSLLVFKETETFGIFGSAPSQFNVRKMEDDGCLHPMGIQPYGGGAVWPGRNGIYYYDGVNTQNITQSKLGDVWKNTVRNVDHDRYRCWSLIARNHYMLFLESVDPSVKPRKGNTAQAVTQWTVVINMVTQAITMFTNVGVRGSVIIPRTTSRQAWYLLNSGTVSYICDTEDLFDVEGLDALTSQDSVTTGPDIFFESKKFDIGDGLQLKRFKQFSVWYLTQGAGLKMDTVLGLNNIGTTLTTILPASVLSWDQLGVLFGSWDALALQYATWDDISDAVFQPKRARFSKKSQYFSIRLYRENSTGTRVQFGPFQLLFKTLRKGRVS